MEHIKSVLKVDKSAKRNIEVTSNINIEVWNDHGHALQGVEVAARVVKTWNAHDQLVKIAKSRLESLSLFRQNLSQSSIHELKSIEKFLKSINEL